MINKNQNEVRVKINHLKKSSDGVIWVKSWDKKERTKRALKFGGACWGFALVSIALPIVHFVLVPSLFLAGPFVFLWVLKQENVVLGGEGLCPYCNAKLPIEPSSYRFPMTDTCTSCQQNVEIVQA